MLARGRHAYSITRFMRAMRLSPLDLYILRMQNATEHAHFFADHFDEASLWAAQVLRERPDFHDGLRIAATSNALSGRAEPAHKAVTRSRQLDRELRVSHLKDIQGPYSRP